MSKTQAKRPNGRAFTPLPDGWLGFTFKHMTIAHTARLTTLGIAAVMTITACSQGADPAALVETDKAFAGITTDGVAGPMASRVVRVGLNGPRSAACGTTLSTGDTALAVHWSNSAATPAKAQVSGEFAACEVDGEWTGIVFPAVGQNMGYCGADVAVRSVREYQGPCRWGWVESAAIAG